MKSTYVLMAVSVGMLAACSELNELEKNTILNEAELVKRVIFEVPVIHSLGEDGETRASLSQEDEEAICFGWEATDTVGIYPDQGAQVYFSMEDGIGTNVATFDGGGWKLHEESTYSCYYPFVGSLYLERDAIPVSFTGQEQTGFSNFEGVRFYLASEGTTSQSGSLRFTFQMLNTIIRIKAIGLPAGTYTRLSITTDEPLFVQKGSFGLEDMTITGDSFSNSLVMSLKDITLTETSTEENPVLFYMTSAPVALTNKTVTIRVYSDNGYSYGCVKMVPYDFDAGTCGSFKCEMEKESAIFYTSTDNNIVTPANPNAFGATITSNVYDGSRGILTFDGNVTEIGDNAFENCTTLTGIEIPETVISIGDYAFSGCTNLGADDTPASMTRMFRAPAPFRSGEASFVIPNSVTSIGASAFQNCTSLTSITIPHGVTSIGDGTFAECSHLVSVTIPETVISIGVSAFESCFDLTDVLIPIPNSITSIGPSAFMSCTSLTSFTIPSGVTAINDFTFSSCHSLASVSIPNGVESIGADAFSLCSSLTCITIPNGVTTIDRRAFAESKLASIVIPESVNSIKEWAFNGCSTLTHITVHAVNPPADVTESTFANTNDCFIYVPSEKLNAYKTATGWSYFASRICDHVYVDMGNGMKWATTNVGAIGPDDLGNHFAWGKTEPIVSPIVNYGGDFTDTANTIWGGSWRMPTLAEWQALMDGNNYTWIWDNDRKGYTVISKIEGFIDNSIFLPAAGVIADSGIMYVGQEGNYWIPSSYSEGEGYCVTLEQGGIHPCGYGYSAGLSVRPVYESTPNGGMEKPIYPETEINL